MIFKRFTAGTEEELPELLKVSSRGIDADQMDKLASTDILKDLNIEKESGHSYIHLITTGAGEFYGANNNADFFPEASRTEHFPEGHEKTAKLGGGLKEYHCTYNKYGGVYHNHRNSKKGYEPQGEIVHEWYNPDMHRGQLIIKVADDLKDEEGNYVWHDTLEKLARDEPVLFSQGCSVEFDRCAACGHIAKTASDRCSHIKNNKLGFHKSGKQICMINDEPYFHDISVVQKPADRIAFALEKAASETSLRGGGDLFYPPASLINKLGTADQQDRSELLLKLSEMEKRLPMVASDVKSSVGCGMNLPKEDEDHVISKLKGIPKDFLLDRLKKHNMMLTPRTFSVILLDKNPSEVPGFSSINGLLKSVFSEIKENEDPNEVLSDGSYKPVAPLFVPNAEDRIRSLSGLLSMDHEPLQDRIIRISVKGEPEKEKTAAEPTAEAGVLAKEYAKYQLSFLASDKEDNRKVFLTVLNNNSR